MDELSRLTHRGNQVIPAPRAHCRRDLQDPVGDGITAVVIIEKPAVQLLFTERRLNGVQIHIDPRLPTRLRLLPLTSAQNKSNKFHAACANRMMCCSTVAGGG